MELALLVLAFCGACFARDHSACSTKDVAGTYALAFLANDAVLVPGAPISGPFMRIGSLTADGRGGVHAAALALYNGINFGLKSFDGTYPVTSDCAFDMHVAVPAPVFANAEFKGQIALDGDDVAFMPINTDGPPAISTVAGFGEMRNTKSCSNESTRGSWRLEINGTSNSTAGGTYQVHSGCGFDLNSKIGAEPYSIRGSIIDGDNAFPGLNLPGFQGAVPPFGQVIVTGAVATGKMVRQTRDSSGKDHDR